LLSAFLSSLLEPMHFPLSFSEIPLISHFSGNVRSMEAMSLRPAALLILHNPSGFLPLLLTFRQSLIVE
jgi:hypothetical protein